jgi:hypothetical protein
MQVGLKPLSSRGQYLVELMADGSSVQFLGVTDEVWMFRGDYPRALEKYQDNLAVVEPQWNLHVEAELYDRPSPPFPWE